MATVTFGFEREDLEKLFAFLERLVGRVLSSPILQEIEDKLGIELGRTDPAPSAAVNGAPPPKFENASAALMAFLDTKLAPPAIDNAKAAPSAPAAINQTPVKQPAATQASEPAPIDAALEPEVIPAPPTHAEQMAAAGWMPGPWDAAIQALVRGIQLAEDYQPPGPLLLQLQENADAEPSYLIINGDPSIPAVLHLCNPVTSIKTVVPEDQLTALDHLGVLTLSTESIVKAITSQGSSLMSDFFSGQVKLEPSEGHQAGEIQRIIGEVNWPLAGKYLTAARNAGALTS